VPTWDYISVQARGRLEVVDDAAWLRGHLDAISAQQEAPFSDRFRKAYWLGPGPDAPSCRRPRRFGSGIPSCRTTASVKRALAG